MGDSDQITFTDGTFYQGHFDSREYLNTFYGNLDGSYAYLYFFLDQLNETFASGNIKGKKLIEIGGGPTIHGLISPSKHFEEIVASDYTDSNRREIEKWLRNEEGCFDWRPIIQFVCELEGRSRSPEEVEQRLRQMVKQVLRCDVRQENPFHPLTVEPVDCILSSLCLDAACEDLETYRCALESVAALLKPGGVLVLTGGLNSTFYFVGQKKFSSVVLSQSFVEETIIDLGFTIKQISLLSNKESELESLKFNAVEFFYLVAEKTK